MSLTFQDSGGSVEPRTEDIIFVMSWCPKKKKAQEPIQDKTLKYTPDLGFEGLERSFRDHI